MQYFNYLSDEKKKSIFYIEPAAFSRQTDPDLLSFALGATLYMPATNEKIADDIITKRHIGLSTIVLCLEDAIADNEICKAEECIINVLNRLKSSLEKQIIKLDDIPLIFVRVRNVEQIRTIVEKAATCIYLLTGFVLPKFSIEYGEEYLSVISNLNLEYKTSLYAMPILETRDIIYEETRKNALSDIRDLLDKYKRLILNVRIGATDFCSLFGIRRNYDVTIYDINVIKDCISSIINYFARREKEYVVSGPVWEYFSTGERVLKPQMRVSPFKTTYGQHGREIRSKMLDMYIDGLIHETILDKTNGLIGKTIIHPSHILPVQALYVVSHEEYSDAINIISNNTGKIGVTKSPYSNKMNEIKPHLNWAKKIINRSKIYGVYNEHQTFTDLLPTEKYL